MILFAFHDTIPSHSVHYTGRYGKDRKRSIEIKFRVKVITHSVAEIVGYF